MSRNQNLKLLQKRRSFALHEFEDLESASFNISDYSALKFGSDRAARLFGYQMASSFYNDHLELLLNERCIVVPSAFNVVKIASTILAHHFMNKLNDLLIQENMDGNIVEWTTMHRSMSYVADYCTLSVEKRKKLIEGDRLYINKDYIKNKTLLFVDDVKITGTHEDKIEKLIGDLGLYNKHIFCYAARYTGNSPEIESQLNHSGIRTLDDYIKLVNEPNHHMVVRAVRFLLDQPATTLNLALSKLSDSFISKLYFACISQYHQIEEYQDNFRLIKARYDRINTKGT